MQVSRITQNLREWDDYAKRHTLTAVPTSWERRFLQNDPDAGEILRDGGSIGIDTFGAISVDGTKWTVISRRIFVRDKTGKLQIVFSFLW